MEGDDMDIEHGSPKSTDDDLRERAVKRLRQQHDFRVHLAIYVSVNLFLVAIWWFTGAGFFWPAFPLFAWGIGVAANAWEAYGRENPTEEQIQREIDRLRG
jgi:2TM domain